MRHTYFRQYHVTPTGPYGLYTRTRGLYYGRGLPLGAQYSVSVWSPRKRGEYWPATTAGYGVTL